MAFILTHEDAQNPIGVIQNQITKLPSQYADMIYNKDVKQFVFCLNDANSEQENSQLNMLINELKKGTSQKNLYYQAKDIRILPMSHRMLGPAFEPRNSDLFWKRHLELTPEYFKKNKMQLGMKFSQ